MTRPFVILDRDGTIIRECHYLSDPRQVELIPGSGSALLRLSEIGLGLVVATNQSQVGRGLFSKERLAAIHHRLEVLLEAEGVRLDGIYYCPHTPEDDCSCRKPEPGLVVRAAGELGFDPAVGFMVGDKACDIELGHRVGATTILVRTGHGMQHESITAPGFVVDSIADVVPIIKSLLSEQFDGDPFAEGPH
jgi:D-glycero-D-manno-heptose 1,7-bisphosphate phosphatase